MKVTKQRRRARLSKRAGAMVALGIFLVLTLCFGFLGVNGTKLDSRGLHRLLPWIPTTNVEKWPASIVTGLDLNGGAFVEYEATMGEAVQAEGDDYEARRASTIEIVRKRLTGVYPEATVAKLGENGIRVEFPAVSDVSAVLELVSAPAKLEFVDPTGVVFMDGQHLETVAVVQDASGNPAISFKLNPEGTQLFADMTEKSMGQTIAVNLDGVELMAPMVNMVIADGNIVVTADFSAERAQTIALQLQSGVLPLNLRQDKLEVISASLGMGALEGIVRAVTIGVLLLMVALIVRYRVFGIAASWALCIFMMVFFLIIAALPGIQLTLPGIAGIVLGIVLLMDAFVIILEKIKDEAKTGRPLTHAVRVGFQNASGAVVTNHVVVAIAAIVFLLAGAGALQSFATTLLLGVLASIFTALVIFRFLLNQCARVFLSNSAACALGLRTKGNQEAVKEEAK